MAEGQIIRLFSHTWKLDLSVGCWILKEEVENE